MKTSGTSNKLLATIYGACGSQIIALLVTLAATGEFDRVAWAQVGGIALTAVFGTIVGYAGKPDDQEIDPALNVPGGGAPPA